MFSKNERLIFSHAERVQAWPQENRFHPQQQRIRVHLQLRVRRIGRRFPRRRSKNVCMKQSCLIRVFSPNIDSGIRSCMTFHCNASRLPTFLCHAGRDARNRHLFDTQAAETSHRTGAGKAIAAQRAGEQRRAVPASQSQGTTSHTCSETFQL